MHKMQTNHSAYNTRVRLKHYNARVCALHCHSETTAASLVRRFAPQLTHHDHVEIAAYHEARAQRLSKIWNSVLERAHQQTFGRPWSFGDYKVSGIGRDEYAESHKRVLRHCAHRQHEHKHLARVHQRLARSRRRQPKI